MVPTPRQLARRQTAAVAIRCLHVALRLRRAYSVSRHVRDVWQCNVWIGEYNTDTQSRPLLWPPLCRKPLLLLSLGQGSILNTFHSKLHTYTYLVKSVRSCVTVSLQRLAPFRSWDLRPGDWSDMGQVNTTTTWNFPTWPWAVFAGLVWAELRTLLLCRYSVSRLTGALNSLPSPAPFSLSLCLSTSWPLWPILVSK